MKVLNFIKMIEDSVVEIKMNLANGELTEDTEVEVYVQHDDNYIVLGGNDIKIFQLGNLEKFIKDYALNESDDADELEDIDLDEDEWEINSLDSDMLNDAKNGKTIAIVC